MSEPPQFSPDGKWRWDGAKWVPASEALPEAPAWQVVQTEGGPVSVAPLAVREAIPSLLLMKLTVPALRRSVWPRPA